MQTSFFTDNQAPQGNSSAIAAAAGGGSPKDLFTTLLVAQIKNQNPLEPTDPSAFVNQLTQLSQMESLQNLSSQNNTHVAMLESLQALGMGAQVGSQVMVQSHEMQLGQDVVKGAFHLNSPSTRTAVVLTDDGGNRYRVELGSRPAGEAAFAIDPVAMGLPQGHYTLAVDSASGETPSIEVGGTLQSVKLSATGGVVLDVSHLGEVPASAITRFNGRSAT
ncbi:MAG: flagellar hook capping FlgD N-terminal domain-containing protein [Acidobacteriota bacterium]